MDAEILAGLIEDEFVDDVLALRRELRPGGNPIHQIRGRFQKIITSENHMLRHVHPAEGDADRGHERRRSDDDFYGVCVAATGVGDVDAYHMAVADDRCGGGTGTATALNQNQRSIGVAATAIRDGGSYHKTIHTFAT